MWAIAKTSLRNPSFCAAQQFAIHVLAGDDKDLAMSFAKDGRYFDPTKWEITPGLPPKLKTARSTFVCEQHAIHDGGDHSIILGKVIECNTQEGQSLVFCSGQYASL
jgi:flavin reductase (DIM6/NTAB) family NADH-FMN oxidoreductase RutF